MENGFPLDIVLLILAALILYGTLLFKLNDLVILEKMLAPVEGFLVVFFNIGAIAIAAHNLKNTPHVLLFVVIASAIVSISFVTLRIKIDEQMLANQMDRDDLEKAERMIKAYPKFSEPYEMAGDVYRRKRKYETALEYYTKAEKVMGMDSDNREIREKILSTQRDIEYILAKKGKLGRKVG